MPDQNTNLLIDHNRSVRKVFDTIRWELRIFLIENDVESSFGKFYGHTSEVVVVLTQGITTVCAVVGCCGALLLLLFVVHGDRNFHGKISELVQGETT